MRLSTLHPELHTRDRAHTDHFPDAASVIFDCPGCAGTSHKHRIWAPFQGKGMGRVAWCAQGTGLEDLTFVDSPEGSRSIRVLSGCKSHFNVTAGAIDFYGDSGHTAFSPAKETIVSEPETNPPVDETEAPKAKTNHLPVAPDGYAKTVHLKKLHGVIYQRHDCGDIGAEMPFVWVPIPDEDLPPA